MRRALISLTAVLALTAGVVVASALPASANATITATSVALNANANCGDSSLDIGMTSGTVDTETGQKSDLNGVIGDSVFSQSSGFSDFDGVLEGYGIGSSDLPDGSLVGTYASIGEAPLTASSAAEWFVLYGCSTSGDNVVLYSCYGDLGTCPTTAVEALALISLDASLTPSTVAPGGAFAVNGTNCRDELAGALLFDGETALGVGDTVAPNPDGSFSIPLVVPDSVASGTTLTVRVDCGSEEGGIVDSITLPLQVVVPTTTTEAPAVAAEVTPAFTG
jgi:hypothetical protein